MAEEKSTKSVKVKKKRWIDVIAPKIFNNELVGEIPVTEPKTLIGRAVTANLMNICWDSKKQNINVKLVIYKVEGDNAQTYLTGYYLNPTSIKRLARRGKDKIETSFTIKTSDNKMVRIKTLIVSPTKMKRSVSTSLWKACTSSIAEYISKVTFHDAVMDIISGKLKKSLREGIKKIYPIRLLEITQIYLENEDIDYGAMHSEEEATSPVDEAGKDDMESRKAGEEAADKEQKTEEVAIEGEEKKEEKKAGEKGKEKDTEKATTKEKPRKAPVQVKTAVKEELSDEVSD